VMQRKTMSRRPQSPFTAFQVRGFSRDLTIVGFGEE
jgi:hypothetical protein